MRLARRNLAKIDFSRAKPVEGVAVEVETTAEGEKVAISVAAKTFLPLLLTCCSPPARRPLQVGVVLVCSC